MTASALVLAVSAVSASVLAPTPVTYASAPWASHPANPYVGAIQYLNPDYTAEVDAQAATDGGALGAQEATVAGYPTAVWMDRIAAIDGSAGHHGLAWHLDAARAQRHGHGNTPIVVTVAIYDLPGRDCAAVASNGELPATPAGLAAYEHRFIDPIADIMAEPRYRDIRIAAVIEPDSLPNAVTNQGLPTCAAAAPYYERGIEYALNRLHAIPNVYDFLDIGQSAWLGWPDNMSHAVQEYTKIARATSAGPAGVDGFISNTDNYVPTTEPFLPDSSLQVGGQPLKSAAFYQWNPYFDEYSYDTAMYQQLVAAGFPATTGVLIDTSRNGWGGPARPTSLDPSPTTADAYAAANKIDQRPYRGDWCNQNGAGLGARPTAQPFGPANPIFAYVWIKPPGESDGGHNDPMCDPSGVTGGYPTNALSGASVPAGQWFGAEFRQLVQNAYPRLADGNGS